MAEMPNEGEIEEVLLDDTSNNQKSCVLLLEKPECCFSGYQQDSEVDKETLKTAVIRDSPAGDVAYDAALVSTDVVVPDIQEPPSSCVVMFADDATDSRNEKNREKKFADDSIDSRSVTKHEGNFADDGIAPRTVTKQEGHFSDDAIISSTVKKQEDDFADDGIDSRTVTKQQGHFADDAIDSSTVKKQEGFFADYAIVSSTVKKQENNFSHDGIDSSTVTKQERIFSDYAICSSAVTKQGGKFAGDGVNSRTVTKLERNFSDDAIRSRTVKKQEKLESLKCALKIQVIDETALIESPSLGNGTFNNGKRPKTQGTKEKRPKRRISKAEKNVETSGTRSQDCGYIGNKGKKRLMYSRKEMEALRFVGSEAQKNKWIEIYCGLGPLVAKEYDELSHHQKHNATGFDFDPRNQFLGTSVPPRYSGRLKLAENQLKNVNTIDTASCFPGRDVLDCSVVEGECSEDDTTDEDYGSIKKPAFLVTGEPDFDSGPPQDELEYLRRVRWEAEQIPKVAVAMVKKSKQNKEQTIYMPQIPYIMKCPDNLLPLKQWEDSFLADFSKLRLDLMRLELEGSSAKVPDLSQSIHEQEMVDQICF